jgi:hypothetical protein
LAIWLLSDPKETIGWSLWAPALLAQYLGYFLLIYALIKITKVLKITRAENSTKEESKKDSPTHLS